MFVQKWLGARWITFPQYYTKNILIHASLADNLSFWISNGIRSGNFIF